MTELRRVLRWEVPVDDYPHEIGGGAVVYVANRGEGVTGRVEVWTEEKIPADWPAAPAIYPTRVVQVFGTGHQLPAEAFRHLGSVIDADGALVWHCYEMQRPNDGR